MKNGIKKQNEIEEISLEGFKTVSSDMFRNYTFMRDPFVTLWYTHISFNKASIVALNCCERIRIEVNSKTKQILIIPVTARDRDGVKWIKDPKIQSSKKLSCKPFSSILYDTWGLKKDHAYRAVGHIVTSESKVMMLYDFNKPETWLFQEKENGKNNE